MTWKIRSLDVRMSPSVFAFAMAGECFWKIDRFSDEVINNDLLVRILPVWLLVTN